MGITTNIFTSTPTSCAPSGLPALAAKHVLDALNNEDTAPLKISIQGYTLPHPRNDRRLEEGVGLIAALALLARLVEHRECLQAPLVALRALRGRQRLAGLSPTPAGIARLRRSAALLVASSFMIRASIQGV